MDLLTYEAPDSLHELLDDMRRLAREIGGLMDIRRKAVQSDRRFATPIRGALWQAASTLDPARRLHYNDNICKL